MKYLTHKSELYFVEPSENFTGFALRAKARLVVCFSLKSEQTILLHSFPILSFRLAHQRSARGGACSRSYLEICCSLAGDP